MALETIAAWLTIAAYAASTVSFVVGVMLGKPKAERLGVVLAAAGLAIHAVGIAARWARIGHGPFLGFYEVASFLAFVAVAGFLVLVHRYQGLRIAGVALMPACFLIMGGTLLVNPAEQAVTGSLASSWLVIHVIFANLAFGAYAVSFVLAAAYLMKDSGAGRRWESLLDRFPEPEVLDSLSFRYIGAGFVFQGTMIASGAIWANEAWGRYWGWDPMETWSLIAWALYAIYLHLTLTLGWKGRKAAWVAVASLGVIVFSLLGVPIFYNSIHGAYLKI